MPTPLRNAWRRPRNIPFAKLAPGYVADVSDVPFRTSIAPSVGSTPTLTRALAATVVDHEGIVRTAKSGELRFSGLRRVENLQQHSQTFGNAAWIKSSCGVTENVIVAPDGTLTADKLIETSAATVDREVQQISVPFVAGAVMLASLHVKAAERRKVQLRMTGLGGSYSTIYATVDMLAGTISGPGVVNASGGACGLEALPDGWFRVYVKGVIATGNTTVGCDIYFVNDAGVTSYAGSVGYGFYAWGAQLENVTGQAVQTPGEYVSNGVLSAPFHGAGVDGVKYFNTTLAGVAFANVPRCLVESSRTNLLLNSDVPATQSIATTAQTYTVSMYGTGTCTLSGTATGVLTGTGAGNRVTRTVTATAGTLTLTFAGSNAKGQIEAGSVASSYIATAGAAVTRPADVLAHNLSLGNAGTWVVTVSPGEVPASAGLYPMVSLQATAGNLIGLFMHPALTTVSLTVYANGVQTISGSIQSSVVAGGVYRVALSWSAANRRISYCVNGGTPGAVTGVNMPQALTSFSTAAGNPWIGTVSDSEIFTVEHPPETLKLMSAL